MKIRTAKQAYSAVREIQRISRWSLRRIGRECGMSHNTVMLILAQKGRIMPRDTTLAGIEKVYARRDELKAL